MFESISSKSFINFENWSSRPRISHQALVSRRELPHAPIRFISKRRFVPEQDRLLNWSGSGLHMTKHRLTAYDSQTRSSRWSPAHDTDSRPSQNRSVGSRRLRSWPKSASWASRLKSRPHHEPPGRSLPDRRLTGPGHQKKWWPSQGRPKKVTKMSPNSRVFEISRVCQFFTCTVRVWYV